MERRKGNDRYRAGDFEAAKYHYQRAKAVVDMVKGQGEADQAEIDANKVSSTLVPSNLSLQPPA